MAKNYRELITEQYNEFADQYEKAIVTPGAIEEVGFAAFMCNNIALGVSRSSQEGLKDYFYKYASRE